MISFEKDGIEYRFFDHLYAVSRCGKVLRKMSDFTPGLRGDGYMTLGRMRLWHRVVATCWCDGAASGKHVHHINGDKSDNRADNLEWLTPREHISDQHKHSLGRHIRTPETRAKLSAARLGKRDSAETIAKKRVGWDEHRNKHACKFKGIVYPMIRDGAFAAGLKYQTFRVRCLSKNFPDYELL